MRSFGYILLLGGFVWLLYDAAIGFSEYQYVAWMDHHKNKLPAGDPVPRRDAIAVMRRLSLDLKDQQRLVIVPACLMLAGGLMVGVKKRTKPNHVTGANSR